MWNSQALTYSNLLTGTTAATTARTANLDCQDADYATIVVQVSAEANTDSTNVVASILESDDTTASNFATFDSDHERTIDNTAAAIGVFHVDMRGRKRYLRLSLTPDTTTNGAVIVSAAGIVQPGSVQSAVASTVSVTP
jgi:hypothetical protein